MPDNPPIKFTEAALRGLPSDGDWRWDDDVTGFGVRCHKGGAKTFAFIFRPKGKGRKARQETITIGGWPTVSVDAARDAARIYAGVVAGGGNPAETRREDKRREQARIGQLLAGDGPYEKDLRARKVANVKQMMSSLRRGLKTLFHTDMADATRPDFVRAITTCAADVGPGAADALRRYTRTLCEWSVTNGHAHHNVMAGYRQPPLTKAQRLTKTTRGRKLEDHEIVALWRACDAAIADGDLFGAFVQLALLTAMRRTEAATLHRPPGNADRLTLYAPNTKMGVTHLVHLTALMRAVIATQPRRNTGPLLFASPMTGGKIGDFGARVEKLREASGVAFTLHDLRRTCRSLMTRVGIIREVAELAIGHTRKDVYDLELRWEERVEAFTKVSAYIEALIEAHPVDNVVPLPVR